MPGNSPDHKGVDPLKHALIQTVFTVGTPQKRPLQASPTSSPVQNAPTYKRIRLMSDSSTDGESSPPVSSPTKVADELPFVDKVEHLHNKFPTYTKEVQSVLAST